MAETLLLGTVGTVDDHTTQKMGPRGDDNPRRCRTCETVFTAGPRFCPFDGELLEDVSHWDPSGDPIVGKIIDERYEVRSVIGEGGMGTVYHVHHLGLDRGFALKLLRREHAADRESVDRFLQEARVAAGLGHENLVAVTDFGELGRATVPGLGDMTLPYFVMDRLEGESLGQLLRREHRLTPERTVEIVTQCASGLSAAHAAGVVHRDLKPENVFLVRQGDREIVKLLDFGVAKILGASRLTRVGTVYGTPHYMSPEHASGESVDARADVYALGVILYECLAGRVPFSADTFMGVLTHHMFTEPEPLEAVAPPSPLRGSLAPVAMRCLAKRPDERFASMDELVEALKSQVAGTGKQEPESRRSRRGSPGSERGGSDPALPLVGASPGLWFGPRWPWLVVVLGLGVLVGVWVGLSNRSSAPGATDAQVNASAERVDPNPRPVSSPASPVLPPAVDSTAGSAADVAASAATAVTSAPRPHPRGPVRRPARGSEIVDPWAD